MTHVAGTGCYLPEQILDNSEVARLAGVEEAWIVRRTGIRERRVAPPEEGTAVMGRLAAARALESAGVSAEQVDVIIVATSTPDHLTPPTACEIQAEIGAFSAACFDVEAGFAGWIFAFICADALLSAGTASAALVVGVDKLSAVTDRSNPDTAPLFGDGAGAAVLCVGEGRMRVRASSWWSDGRLASALLRPGGGARRPFDERVLAERSHLLRMEGTRLFRPAVRTMKGQAEQALERAGATLDEVHLLVPHQANARILQALARQLDLPHERLYMNIERYGNTGAATIPIALTEAMAQGRVASDRPTLLLSFGAGATAGAVVLGGD